MSGKLVILVSPDTQHHLQSKHPEAATELDKLRQVLEDSSLDARLLALCGDYIEATLRESKWTPPDSTSELESACLAVCEQFMSSVANISEEQIAALRQHLSTDEVYNLMYAIYLIEMSKRLDLTFERVLQ